LLALVALLFSPLVHAEDHQLAKAALAEGRADDALALLRPMTKADPADAVAQNLLCRVLLSEDRADDAVPACERAASLQPNNAEYHLWLAHATGGKAEHASFMTALSIAHRAHDQFEIAARLAPNDWSVVSDLAEFYVEAPPIAGGGMEKARRILPRLMNLNSARGHWLAARIAEESKDYGTAESEYKLAVGTGLNVSEGWVDLAGFYHRHDRNDEAVDCIHKADAADTERDSVLVDAASVLSEMNRESALAIRLLRSYLQSPARSESAPAFAVHCTLGEILQHQGDRQAAMREYAAALQLDHDYAPALKGMHSR
jgi:tetratricopeptide (TPR) repeat protein